MSEHKAQRRDRITLAIAAMGGQGGGVLADWIIALGEAAGYFVQATSVPGVAQRTGATVYYLEIFPDSGERDRAPVLALMPVSGDVDVVVAAELIEAGRAIQRGLVTPDRTTLIASSHRQYTFVEKSAMGEGRIDGDDMQRAIATAAKHFVCFDMQALAEKHGTVISATLFGALAGSAVLPFARTDFEAAIEGTGKAVENNLAAFAAAYELARSTPVAHDESAAAVAALPPANLAPRAAVLLQRLDAEFPEIVRANAMAGVRRLLDYQDSEYAALYLDRMAAIARVDQQASGNTWRLTDSVAKHLALWMSYEDTIRVADLKVRRQRFERCRAEAQAAPDEIVHVTEFMHPRIEELADTMPEWLAKFLLATPWLRRALGNTVLRERKIATTKLRGFLLLYAISGLRRFRRATSRYALEQRRITHWLMRIETIALDDYELAVEVALCQNLVKGYGDTHARGLRNFNTIIAKYIESPNNDPSAAHVRELRDAALADDSGDALAAKLAALS